MSQTSNEPRPTATPATGPATGPAPGTDDSYAALRAPLPPPEHTPSSTYQGWAYFGAIVMGLLGMGWALLGVIALADEEYFGVRTNELLAFESYAAWGWVHLLGGLLALAAGVGILWRGHRWARTLGIVVAGLSAVANLGFLSASPVWSLLMIGLSVVVIYSLVVHGWEIDAR
jgi:hypothetical protein